MLVADAHDKEHAAALDASLLEEEEGDTQLSEFSILVRQPLLEADLAKLSDHHVFKVRAAGGC
jgi:hypothetical protein